MHGGATGGSREFLAPYPVQVLRDEQITGLLVRLGVRTLGEFTALAPLDVRDRFGEHGARLHALAAGADSRPLTPRPPDPELARRIEFDSPLGGTDQVAFAVRQTADAVMLALGGVSLVCTEVRIELTDDNGAVYSRSWLHPTCFDASDLVDRVRWQLEALAAQSAKEPVDEARAFGGIMAVRIIPAAVDDAAHHQPGLFGSGTDERLHHAVSRVQTMLGHQGVVTAAVAGGRWLADRQVLTPWGERTVPPRDPGSPWPGSLPDPLPAEVFLPRAPSRCSPRMRAPSASTNAGRSRTTPPASRERPCRHGPAPGRCTNDAGPRAEGSEGTGSRSSTTTTARGWSSTPAGAGGPRGGIADGVAQSPLSWNELERTLSGEESPSPPPGSEPRGQRTDPGPVSRRRTRTPPVAAPRPEDPIPYAELHAHSSYSFLDGASSPEELLAEADRLGLTALALTDHDGFYGAARFAEVAGLMESPLQTVFGAELSLDLPAPQRGHADPAGEHLLVLARGTEGYHRLSGAITAAQLRGGEKGRPVYDLDDLAARAGGHWTILTGCRKGAVRRGLEAGDAAHPLRSLVDLFGSEHVAVELFDHGDPLDTRRNDTLAELARRMRLPVVATNNVHYATPAQAPSPRPWPRCARCAAWTSSTGGCPPTAVHTCAAGPRCRRASGATPERSRTGSNWPRHPPSPCASHDRRCRSRRCRRGTRP